MLIKNEDASLFALLYMFLISTLVFLINTLVEQIKSTEDSILLMIRNEDQALELCFFSFLIIRSDRTCADKKSG